jgi:uncharacterized protein (DUF983 family)
METILPTWTSPFKVSRAQIFKRGLSHRCPNCGEKTLFKNGRTFTIENSCAHCGMRWDKDEAAFLGSVTLNYGVTVFGLALPWIVSALVAGLPTQWVVGVASAIALIVPFLLYRSSKSWWLMIYYLVLPRHLPANWVETADDGLPPDE